MTTFWLAVLHMWAVLIWLKLGSIHDTLKQIRDALRDKQK